MTKTTATDVIDYLRTLFALFGLPNELVCDSGPPFNSQEFSQFLQKNQCHLLHSPVTHPASNGQAENMVKNFKKTLMRQLLGPETSKRTIAHQSQQEKIKNLHQNERRFKPGDKVWVRVEVEKQMIYKPASIVKKVSENYYDIELNGRLRHTSSEHLFDRDPLAEPISLKALPRPAIEIPENEQFLVQNPTPVPVINSANNSTPVASSPGELATQVPSVQSSSATPAKATPILTASNPTSSAERMPPRKLFQTAVPSSRPQRNAGLPSRYRDYFVKL
ncbi:hypothetical protein FOCC_FOCC014457 [Frankliniella occidentalis]|nr:hypothetical protein FOCC_FOCC014457 [Frankliniella occidentalis]